MTYDEARIRLAEHLERHATGSRDRLHDQYDEFDASLVRHSDARWDKIFIALDFWGGWIDASNHGWAFYEPIAESDWPRLACELAGDLRADRDISNPVVLHRFDFRSTNVRR